MILINLPTTFPWILRIFPTALTSVSVGRGLWSLNVVEGKGLSDLVSRAGGIGNAFVKEKRFCTEAVEAMFARDFGLQAGHCANALFPLAASERNVRMVTPDFRGETADCCCRCDGLLQCD